MLSLANSFSLLYFFRVIKMMYINQIHQLSYFHHKTKFYVELKNSAARFNGLAIFSVRFEV